jgi:uncharacterized protein (DUF2236 family)
MSALFDPCPAPPRGRAGDPGLYGPGSVAWLIGRERALLAGGGAALLLQIAHPKVAAGVEEHSGFRRDPFARLRATLDAMLRITFGDAEQVEASAREVAAIHRRVRGRLPAAAGRFERGEGYSAGDPDLALWVHTTLVLTALAAFDRFVRPLAPEEAQAYHRSLRRQAALFGVAEGDVPADLRALRGYARSTLRRDLLVTDRTRELAVAVLHPAVRPSARPALGAMEAVTASMLPEPLRRAFGLRYGPMERALVRATAASARASAPRLPRRIRFWPHYLVALERVRAARR